MQEREDARHRKEIGGRIATLRKSRGMTQPELAFAAGITQPSLWAIESGDTKRVTAHSFIALCKALSTTWEYLWEGSAQSPEQAAEEAELVAIYRGLVPHAREAFMDAARMARGVHDAMNQSAKEIEGGLRDHSIQPARPKKKRIPKGRP